MGYAAGRAGAKHAAQEESQEQRLANVESQQAPPPPPPPTAAPAETTVEQLQKLAQLRDSGVLTNEEFEAQKQKVLAGG